MALNFHARLTADGRQAQAEFRETSEEVKRLAAGLDVVEAEGNDAAQSLGRISTRAAKAASTLTDTNAAARGVAGAHGIAAGQVGNLAAQFNDIGVMLAAGQNPLQLAIQQGTQITQVIGPMGAAGAFKALGGAIKSMISPVSLLTLGAIAAGAAMFQWLTRSRDDADDLGDALENAQARIEDLQREQEMRAAGIESEEELRLLQAIEEAQAAVAAASAAAADEDERAARAARGALRIAEEELSTLEETLDILRALEEARDQADRDRAVANAERMLATMEAQNEVQRIAITHGEDSAEFARAQAAAQRQAFEATLETMNVSEDLKDELREAFNQAEALASVDMASGIWNAADAASAMATNLRDAITASNESAARSQIMLDTVGNPVERAGRLAVREFDQSLPDGGYGMISSGQAEGLASARDQVRERAEAAAQLAQAAREADAEWRALQSSTGNARSGGAAQQADAVAELIEQQRAELEIMREADPVKQEMIRLRQTLAGATDGERAQIRANVQAIEAERAANEALGQTRDFVSSSLSDILPALARGGDDATAAWQRFGRVLEDIAWQALAIQPILFALGLVSGPGLIWGSILGLRDGGPVPGEAAVSLTSHPPTAIFSINP